MLHYAVRLRFSGAIVHRLPTQQALLTFLSKKKNAYKAGAQSYWVRKAKRVMSGRAWPRKGVKVRDERTYK